MRRKRKKKRRKREEEMQVEAEVEVEVEAEVVVAAAVQGGNGLRQHHLSATGRKTPPHTQAAHILRVWLLSREELSAALRCKEGSCREIIRRTQRDWLPSLPAHPGERKVTRLTRWSILRVSAFHLL